MSMLAVRFIKEINSYIYTMNLGKLCYKISGFELRVKHGLSN